MGAGTSCCKKDEIVEVSNVIHQNHHEEVPDPIPELGLESPGTEEGKSVEPFEEFPRESFDLTQLQPRLSVDPMLLRGISLRKSLRKLGRIWMTKPSQLTATDHQVLSEASVKVDRFDVFISHTWETSAKLKIWALTLQTGWRCIVVSWLVFNLLAAFLSINAFLPYLNPYWFTNAYWTGWVVISPWMRIAGILSFVVGLAVAAYWPNWPRSDLAFVDVVSIDQADPSMTQRGVYGLGGFLALSRELMVLWSPPLFTRLWCVFELAAFRKANPNGKIVLAPLYVEVLVGLILLWLLFMQLLHFVLYNFFPLSQIFVFLGLLPILLCIHQARKTFGEKRQLLANLRKFDLSLASCSNDFDRRFIYAGIRAWYGSYEAFTEYVRGPVFLELVSPLLSFQVPLRYWVLIGLFEMSSLLEFTVAFIRGGAPIEMVLSQLLASVLSQILWRLLAMQLVFFLCDRCSLSGFCCVDLLVSFGIWLLVVAFLFGSFQLSGFAEANGLAFSAASALLASVASFLAFGGCSCLKQRLSPKGGSFRPNDSPVLGESQGPKRGSSKPDDSPALGENQA
ncbi:tktB [Symbiodinium sp. CCMP2592]|nr:tktB [Symbiodinium sp. CCMP2592]